MVKGVMGMGLPTVAMRLLGTVMPTPAAATILVLPSFMTNVWQLLAGSETASLVQRLWPMMLTIVVGRRSWLFADTVGGANASANLYSLIETTKANGIEPYGYLVALFKKLPLAQTMDDYEALPPWNIEIGAA